MDEYRSEEHARGVPDGRRVRAAARAGDDGENQSENKQNCRRRRFASAGLSERVGLRRGRVYVVLFSFCCVFFGKKRKERERERERERRKHRKKEYERKKKRNKSYC